MLLGGLLHRHAYHTDEQSQEHEGTHQYDDEEKNCNQLKFELSSLGVQFEDAKDDSGLTGKNVALGIFFWPGIIVNERQAKANSKSVNDRITHLNRIYSKKCIKDE